MRGRKWETETLQKSHSSNESKVSAFVGWYGLSWPKKPIRTQIHCLPLIWNFMIHIASSDFRPNLDYNSEHNYNIYHRPITSIMHTSCIWQSRMISIFTMQKSIKIFAKSHHFGGPSGPSSGITSVHEPGPLWRQQGQSASKLVERSDRYLSTIVREC